MICSTSESIEVLYKAARGAGFPAAAAKQAAIAAAWLQCHGRQPLGLDDGFAMMLEAIDAGPGLVSASGPAINMDPEAQMLTADGGSAIEIGPCVLDFLIGDPNCTTATLSGVAGAGLVIGMVLASAEGSRPPISISLSRNRSLLVANLEASTAAASIAVADAAVPMAEAACAPVAGGSPETCDISVAEALWARASELALETHVPSNDASRLRGAGAGLTDND